ncbi:MAG: F0F1 ATP synthase subunit delta [Muribaculaceae bacterium]|nr:F0F1 ATP synthase subunit delta [Muribaculaceae bacterium]
MNDGLIPNRYARALYKLALENGDEQRVYGEMKALDRSYQEASQLKKAVGNPFLPIDEKMSLLCSAASAAPDGSSAKFMRLVVEKKREDFLRAIARAFLKLYRESYGIARVEVVTAASLPQSEVDKIVAMVSHKLGDKQLELSTAVNPALIGGFVVNIDDKELDASVKTQIDKLRLKLLS